MAKRPPEISKRAWRVMQCLRNGDTLACNHATGFITIIGVCPVSFDTFEELRAAGHIIPKVERPRFTTYRLSNAGWDFAAGDRRSAFPAPTHATGGQQVSPAPASPAAETPKGGEG